MARRAHVALAAAGLALAAAAPAQAQETATQRFFSERLQSDKQTSTEIKDLLRTRQGFVDRTVVFRDLTGSRPRTPSCACPAAPTARSRSTSSRPTPASRTAA